MAVAPIIDLRPLLGPVRDQGPRPTCLAFAASDAHAAARGVWMELSADYLYLRAQIRAGAGTEEGSSLASVLKVLREDGQPHEAGLPYSAEAPDLGSWQPPHGLPLYRRAGCSGASALSSLRDDLAAGTPTVLLLKLSRSFFFAGPDGFVDDSPDDPPNPEQRHAVIAVGHGMMASRNVTLIRNSWGAGWAAHGYAWLPDEFLLPRLYATAKMMEDLSVSAHSDAA